MASGISVKLPLVEDETDGCYGLNKDYEAVVKQNFRNLILTAPGERCMMLDFGVGARNYLFAQNSVNAFGDLKAKIYEQASIYMPFIEIEDVQIADLFGSGESINLKIYYKIIPLGSNDLLSLDVSRNIS